MSDLDTLYDTTQKLFASCSVTRGGGSVALSTPPDGAMPWIVTREQALLIVGFTRLGDVDSARQLIRGLLALQSRSGRWDAGYRADGTPLRLDGGVVESTAMATWALLKYVELSEDHTFAGAVEPRLRRALDGLVALVHPQVALPPVDADLLPPAMSRGYSLWTACATAAALKLAADVYRERDYDEVYETVRRTVATLLVQDGRFVIRLDPGGRPDLRPAITLLAPVLFDLWPAGDTLAIATTRAVDAALVDPRIGGCMPFVVYAPAEMGALPGVWPAATAWLAHVLHLQGERERADKLLRWQLGNMIEHGFSKVILTREAFALVQKQRAAFERVARGWPDETLPALLDVLEEQAGAGSRLYPIHSHLMTHVETLCAFHAGGYVKSFRATPDV